VRFNPIVKAVLGVPLSLTLDRPSGTTVKDPGSAVAAVPPTLASVSTSALGSTQAALSVLPRSGTDNQTTILPTGVAPLTRLASASVAAVANARPAPAAAGWQATLTSGLIGTQTPADPGGSAVVNEGELAVITVAQRPAGLAPDTLTVMDGATRLLSLAAGGRPVDDQVVGADGAIATVQLRSETERVIVVGLGADASAAGTLPGWYAGQALPSLGWGAALCGGAVISAQGSRIGANRDLADGGWVLASALVAAAQVATSFTDPVSAVAVAVDDYLGADAAGTISIRLIDASRVLDPAGADPLPPQALVDGVRTILVYAITVTGPEPTVLVEDCGGGQLAGVLGSVDGPAALAALLATQGIEAAVLQPLVGGPGQRRVRYTLGDGPIGPAAAASAEKTTARKAVPAKKAVTKKTAPRKRSR
jgi:hypothetical protein